LNIYNLNYIMQGGPMHVRNLILVLWAIAVVASGCSSNKGKDSPIAVNDPPVITSASTVEATGGIYFKYTARFSDSDGPAGTLVFRDYPSWLTADGDSLFGTPPDGLADTTFLVIVSDGVLADTLRVTIEMIPCLIVIGDTRTNHDIHQLLVDSIETRKPAAVFHTGDLVADGTVADQWVTFNTITAELRAMSEFFPALGNHEKQSQLYFDNFVLPNNEQWYSIDRLNTHFIILNSCVQTDTMSEQYQWLKADLAAIPDSTIFTVAVFHHPPYSTGPHTEDEKGLRQTWVPLFEQYGVDVVFNGHDHDYERSYCGGIYYIVAGGGGAPLYDQTGQHPCSQLFLKAYQYCKLSIIEGRMVVKVFGLDGQIIDQFEVPPPAL
jgi:predicted phosphodiesterase